MTSFVTATGIKPLVSEFALHRTKNLVLLKRKTRPTKLEDVVSVGRLPFSRRKHSVDDNMLIRIMLELKTSVVKTTRALSKAL